MLNPLLEIQERKTISKWLISAFLSCFLIISLTSWLHHLNTIRAIHGYIIIVLSMLLVFITTLLRFSTLKNKPNTEITTQLDNQNIESGTPDHENPFKQLVDNLTDSFCALDKHLHYTYWNKASEKITGLTSEEVIGKHLLEIFPDAAHNQFLLCAQDVLETRKENAFQFKYIMNGVTHHFDIRIHPSGEGISIYTVDITPYIETKIKLKQEKERLEMTLWGAGLGAWDWHIPSKKVTYNEQWAKLIGYELKELNGDLDDWKNRIHPDDYPAVLEKINDHLNGNTPIYKAEHRMRTKDGSWIWTLNIGKAVEKDEQGEAIRMVGIHMNIQPNKELESQLKEQKIHLEFAIQSANLGIWDWYIHENKWVRSDHWYDMLGYKPHEIDENTETWKQITHPDDILKVEEALQNYLEGKSDIFMCEHRTLHKNGHWIWMMGSGKVVERDKDEKPVRMIGLLQDLTFIKEKDSLIKQQKERYEFAINGAELGVWDWYIKSGQTNFNEKWASMLGYNINEIKPNIDSWAALVHPEDMPKIRKTLDAHFEGKTDHYRAELRMKTKNGEWKWILDIGKVVERNNEGKARRVIGIHLDIDAAKKMEFELREQKEQLEIILWAANLGIWDLNVKPPFSKDNVRINESCASMLGYTVDEYKSILGSEDWTKLIHPDDKETSLEKLNKHYLGETEFYSVQHRNLTKDGQWKWVLNTGKIVQRDEQGNPVRFSGVQQDVSEIKEAESSLYFFKNLVEQGSDPAYGLDPHDHFKMIYVNNSACEHFGLSEEEIIGKTIYEWKPFTTTEEVLSLWERIKKERSITFETVHKSKNGKLIPVEITASYTTFDQKELVTGYIKNISERKAAENRIKEINIELEERVQERTAELEASNQELEAFSYSVSHDLRSPLRSIDGFSKALLEDYYDILDDEGKDFLQSIRNATSNMGVLIDDLLKLSKVTRAELSREEIDISLIIRNHISILQNDYPHRQVATDIPSGITVKADKKLISIAIQNLIENAWKFTSCKENAKISFEVKEENDTTVYVIKDNGAGFDMNYAHKLFGAFQRLHHADEFEGTGIGLATVQRIINRHGGNIWAEGEVDKGASFYFTLA